VQKPADCEDLKRTQFYKEAREAQNDPLIKQFGKVTIEEQGCAVLLEIDVKRLKVFAYFAEFVGLRFDRPFSMELKVAFRKLTAASS